ncbi:hypothetical protein T260_11910 [Geobacillus thermopakistaniensis]|uniref:Uncharacterized protein n=1 Tax=Geobacillus thermopakistaniensis (strain MAS1) TaxID=1408282 RepID=A0A7U9P6M4_GEOTM|nr:hypothetical protein T260_11910 [Geobacillus sp. MAS1]
MPFYRCFCAFHRQRFYFRLIFSNRTFPYTTLFRSRKPTRNDSVEQQQKKQQPDKDREKQPGCGDKKLEGPNHPAE